MATKETLSIIKRNVQDCIGEKVVLKTNKGRKKVLVKEGVLEEVYSNIFIVRINNGLDSERTVSYSYSDVLTETVEIKLLRNERNIFFAS
ncbi:MAG TPA: Veg family protein [Clostridia bacterium]|nr:MAG: Veg protein [Clostridiales bacterium]HKL10773.1 Veg family protein [Clostridia bacterium]